MADDTYIGKGIYDIIQEGKQHIVPDDYEDVLMNGTCYAGDIITRSGETAPDFAPAVAGDTPYAIVLGPTFPEDISNYTIDTQIPDNSYVKVLKFRGIGSIGCVVALKFSGHDTEDPTVEPHLNSEVKLSSVAGEVLAWEYADAARATDTYAEVIGTLARAVTLHATDMQIGLVKV